MNDLLSEEHYCYKNRTLQTKSSTYPRPPFSRCPPHFMDSPSPFHIYHSLYILKKNLSLPSIIFQIREAPPKGAPRSKL